PGSVSTPTSRAHAGGGPRRASPRAGRSARRRTTETASAARPSRGIRARARSDRSDAWCRRGNGRRRPGRSLVEGGGRLDDPAIDFRDRLLQLRAAAFVGRRRELRVELLARELQRFVRTNFFRIANDFGVLLRPFALELLHPFLDTGVLIDESFAGVTHNPHIIR